VLWCKIQIVLGMAFHAAALFRPYWSRPKLVYRMTTDTLLAAIAVWAMTIDSLWVGVYGILLVFVLIGIGSAIIGLRRVVKFDAAAAPIGAPDLLATWLGLTAAAKKATEIAKAHGEKAIDQIDHDQNRTSANGT